VRADIAGAPAAVSPIARAAANLGRPLKKDDSNEPLPEKGNVMGFLHAAAKTDAELAGGTEADFAAAQAEVEAIKTKGEARAYLNKVEAKVDAVQAAKENAGNEDPNA
jgi:hypothetical protein